MASPRTPQEKKRPREHLAEQELLLEEKIHHEQKKRYHGDTGRTVFVRGIPEAYNEKEVLGLFGSRDDIEEVRIVKDRSGRSKGFCYVDFKTSEAAQDGTQLLTQNAGRRGGTTSP